MITFTLLMITLFVLTIIIALTVGIGGALFFVVFADLIVCIALIVWIIKRLIQR